MRVDACPVPFLPVSPLIFGCTFYIVMPYQHAIFLLLHGRRSSVRKRLAVVKDKRFHPARSQLRPSVHPSLASHGRDSRPSIRAKCCQVAVKDPLVSQRRVPHSSRSGLTLIPAAHLRASLIDEMSPRDAPRHALLEPRTLTAV